MRHFCYWSFIWPPHCTNPFSLSEVIIVLELLPVSPHQYDPLMLKNPMNNELCLRCCLVNWMALLFSLHASLYPLFPASWASLDEFMQFHWIVFRKKYEASEWTKQESSTSQASYQRWMKLGYRHKELQQRDLALLYCSLIGLPKQKRNWPPVCHQFILFFSMAKLLLLITKVSKKLAHTEA